MRRSRPGRRRGRHCSRSPGNCPGPRWPGWATLRLKRSATPAEVGDGERVAESAQRAEPAVWVPIVAAGDLDEEADDHRDYQHLPDYGRRTQVHQRESLVAAVAAQTADSLTAAGERDEKAEACQDGEPDQAARQASAQPARQQDDAAEGDAEGEHEPAGASKPATVLDHRTSPRP